MHALTAIDMMRPTSMLILKRPKYATINVQGSDNNKAIGAMVHNSGFVSPSTLKKIIISVVGIARMR
jgi:hypothetical protein